MKPPGTLSTSPRRRPATSLPCDSSTSSSSPSLMNSFLRMEPATATTVMLLNLLGIRAPALFVPDQQGDHRDGDTFHPVSMFCKATVARSTPARSLLIVNATFA
eukprot:10521343-Heterocapsa_arctica.AAC.1